MGDVSCQLRLAASLRAPDGPSPGEGGVVRRLEPRRRGALSLLDSVKPDGSERDFFSSFLQNPKLVPDLS